MNNDGRERVTIPDGFRDAVDALPAVTSGAANTAEELAGVVCLLGQDERRVMLWIARRLLGGQKAYGVLSLDTDERDWKRARAEEIEDLLVYTSFESLKNVAKGVRHASSEDEQRAGAGDPGTGDRGGTTVASEEIGTVEDGHVSRADRGRCLDGVRR